MARFFLCFCLFLLASSGALALDASECPAFTLPVITLTPLKSDPKLDRTRSLASLELMARAHAENFSSTGHESPVGLTAASLTVDATYKIMIQQLPASSLYCAQISNLNLRFGFDDTVIYMAREISANSCGFKTVLAHEMRHVMVDEAFVDAQAFPLSKDFDNAIQQIGIIQRDSPEEAKQEIQEAMDHFIKQTGQTLSVVRKREQAKIDTKDEYARISHTCNGELGDLIALYKPR